MNKFNIAVPASVVGFSAEYKQPFTIVEMKQNRFRIEGSSESLTRLQLIEAFNTAIALLRSDSFLN